MSSSEVGFSNWELGSFFAKFGNAQYQQFCDSLSSDITKLQDSVSSAAAVPAAQSVEKLAQAFVAMEDVLSRIGHLTSYLECARADDANFEPVQEAYAQVDVFAAEFRKAEIVVEAALKALSESQFAELLNHSALENVQHYVKRVRHQALHSMDTALENLAADLEITGFRAWERLYDSMAGKLEFMVEDSQGEQRQVPMALKVSLLEDSDPVVRKTTLANSNKAWQSIGSVMAACLNSISGHRLQLQKRRNIAHFLDEAVFDSDLSRQTLSAMLEAVQAKWDIPRRYLALKAKLFGVDKLGFQDLYAPIPPLAGQAEPKPVTWQAGCELVNKAFSHFSEEFGSFADMAIKDRWVESEVRLGKLPGGFCTSSTPLGQSRIFMTYQGNMGDVFTLAHELGHAYHEWLVRDMRHYCHLYPMTLAETASTFAEQLLGDYLLQQPALDEGQRRAMLSRRLDDAATYLLNIPMRFLFEEQMYKERAAGELSVSRLRKLMLDTQQRVYGEALDQKQCDEWFWASKGHFYITGVSFYNFPYIFGYLFSLGVYYRATQEGPSFVKKFVELLRNTGCGTCEEVASAALGVDLQKPEFWLESISLVEKDLQAFEQMLEKA